MTRLVDGVSLSRRPVVSTAPEPVVSAAPAEPAVRAVQLERPQPLKRSAVAARLPQGRLDGVRRTAPAARPQPRPQIRAVGVEPAVAGPARTSTRPQDMSRPSAPLSRPQAPTRPAQTTQPAAPQAIPMADIRPAQPLPQATEPVPSNWRSRFASWRAGLNWQRPMIGFAMVAMAFVAASLAVRTIAPPPATTARADQVRVAAVTPVPTVPQSPALQKLLDDVAAANPGIFSLYVKDLTTGETASVAADRTMTSASLYKLFVAQRTFAQIDLGQWQLGQAAGSGTGQTIDGCLNLMITYSDNGCGRALGNMLGWGSQDQALAVEGYRNTDLASPQRTSAQDVAALFERLYRGTLLSQRSSTQLLNLLKNQHVNNRLPQGLPAGTVIAHKTGDLDGYVHDAGIVYGPKTNYLVVVMSGSWSSPGNAPGQFANLSTQLWNHFEQ